MLFLLKFSFQQFFTWNQSGLGSISAGGDNRNVSATFWCHSYPAKNSFFEQRNSYRLKSFTRPRKFLRSIQLECEAILFLIQSTTYKLIYSIALIAKFVWQIPSRKNDACEASLEPSDLQTEDLFVEISLLSLACLKKNCIHQAFAKNLHHNQTITFTNLWKPESSTHAV